VCDLETSRICTPYIYDISHLRVNVNFNANLKLFLRLFNCSSVGEKNFDNYQDAWYTTGKNKKRTSKKNVDGRCTSSHENKTFRKQISG
jgi:hypothetical protein